MTKRIKFNDFNQNSHVFYHLFLPCTSQENYKDKNNPAKKNGDAKKVPSNGKNGKSKEKIPAKVNIKLPVLEEVEN